MTPPEAAKPITVDLHDHVALVEIHRPPHNYFDLDVLSELAEIVESLRPETGCRAIVLCSEGKNFCAGADLKTEGVLENTKRLYAIAARLAKASAILMSASENLGSRPRLS